MALAAVLLSIGAGCGSKAKQGPISGDPPQQQNGSDSGATSAPAPSDAGAEEPRPVEDPAKLSTALLGCEDKGIHEGGQGHALTGVIPPGPHLRGVFPIGFGLDAQTTDGSPVRLQLKDGVLSAPAGMSLTNVVLNGVVTCPGKHTTVKLNVRISATRPDPKLPSESPLQQYSAHWEQPLGPPICDPLIGANWTVATSGIWRTESASHADDKDMFSFACEGGAVAKCYDEWDYRPWTGKDAAEKQARGQLYDACVHAVRADYCGNGHSFTKDGTTVDIWDGKYVSKSTKLSPDYTFEAAWTEAGALCKHHVRWGSLVDPAIGADKCVEHVKSCDDEASARKLGGTKPLVFVRSCGPDPCKCQPCLCSPGGCADGGAPPILPHR